MIFLEGNFIDFSEVDKPQEGAPNPTQEDKSDLLFSGSVPSSERVSLRIDSEATFLRKSQRENIPRRHFEIEGKLSYVLC